MIDGTRCALCGGIFVRRTFAGVRAQVCSTCGGIVLEGEAATILLGEPDVQPVQPDPTAPPRSREAATVEAAPPAPLEDPDETAWLLRVGLVLCLVAGVAAVPLAWLVLQRDALRVATSDGDPPAGLGVPEGHAASIDPAEAVPASNVRALVAEGWTLVGEQPNAAADRFRAALALAPRDGEASYGLGYALLQTGAKDEARLHLCRAQGYADRETSREIASLLDHERLTCAP